MAEVVLLVAVTARVVSGRLRIGSESSSVWNGRSGCGMPKMAVFIGNVGLTPELASLLWLF